MELLGVGSRVKHPAFGSGAVVRLHKVAYEICFMQHGLKMVGHDYQNLEIIEAIPAESQVSFTEAEKALVKILKAYNGIQQEVTIDHKWEGGMVILQPGEDRYQGKEIPMDTFFHKIVMVRDRLRVMEQRINSSKNLSEEEKVNLQQYLTRIYGSLTSFNVLFKYKDDHFIGQRN